MAGVLAFPSAVRKAKKPLPSFDTIRHTPRHADGNKAAANTERMQTVFGQHNVIAGAHVGDEERILRAVSDWEGGK